MAVYLAGHTNKVPQEYVDFIVMRAMGWDYYTLDNQPAEWIKMIKMFINLENSIKGRNG